MDKELQEKCERLEAYWDAVDADTKSRRRWQLYGIYEERIYSGPDSWKMEDYRVLVAEFSSKELAEQYVKDSLLKKAKGKYPIYLREGESPYRTKSLLAGYCDAEIEEKFEGDRPPFDPVL